MPMQQALPGENPFGMRRQADVKAGSVDPAQETAAADRGEDKAYSADSADLRLHAVGDFFHGIEAGSFRGIHINVEFTFVGSPRRPVCSSRD